MSRPSVLTPALLKRWLRPRPPNAHKGDFGHALVAAGSRGMTGAAQLCAAGALRSGAGLVTLALPASQQASVARRGRWEVMTLPLPESGGALCLRSLGPVLACLKARRATSVAAGPGLSVNAHTAAFVRGLLSAVTVPLVLDADGLNALARGGWPADKSGRGSFKGRPARKRVPLVLTPHPGEMARLLGVPVGRVQKDRPAAAERLARERKAVCVLKGRRTVVTDGRRTWLNPTGNPGMATGGTGDVLCGLIAGLIPQVRGGDDFEKALRAAALGAYVHGLAGDLAARRRTRLALAAGDILDFLPAAFRRVFGRRI